MWREASVLLMFAVGATLLYTGFEKLCPQLAGLLRRRGGSPRVAAVGFCLLILGAVVIYGAVAQLS